MTQHCWLPGDERVEMLVNPVPLSELAVRISTMVSSFQQGAQVTAVLSAFNAEPAPWLNEPLLRAGLNPVLAATPDTNRADLRAAFAAAITSLKPIATVRQDAASLRLFLGAERALSTMDHSAYVFAGGTAPGEVQTEGIPVDLTQIRVLLVDDEPVVRRGLMRAQGSLSGMTADQFSEASSANEAIDQIIDDKINLDDVDILITDYHMAGKTGIELAELLRQTHPNLPVILISGYHQKVEDDGITAFLLKPFLSDALAEALRQLIAAARQR